MNTDVVKGEQGKQPRLHNRSIGLLMQYAVPDARMSEDAIDYLRRQIELIIIRKTREAYALARHGKRITILLEDIALALGEKAL